MFRKINYFNIHRNYLVRLRILCLFVCMCPYAYTHTFAYVFESHTRKSNLWTLTLRIQRIFKKLIP